MLAALLLAAGAARRMRGADKLLADVDGQALLLRITQRLSAADLPIWVTLPPAPHPRYDILAGTKAHLVEVPDATLGMGHSIASGVAALPASVSAIMIVPADMPDLTTEDFLKMAREHRHVPARILRAHDDRGAGHPVVFPRRCFSALERLEADQGAKSLLQSEAVHQVSLPAHHATTDLDTPEAWAAWRSKQN